MVDAGAGFGALAALVAVLIGGESARSGAGRTHRRVNSPASETGAATRIRTGDPRITNALLYQLSYCGVTKKGGHSNPASQTTEGWLLCAQPTGVSISGFGQNQRDHHTIDLRI